MKTYLFDTQSLSSLTHKYAKGRDKIRSKVLLLEKDDQICASVLSLYEMEYGVRHANDEEIKEISYRAIQFVKHSQNIFIVPLSEKGAEIFGELKEQYQQCKKLGKKALKKHNIDLIIAATAIEFEAVLVSSDGIFEEICELREDFKWEDWTQ
ncbi:PIN domain-containing protein [Candidatus Parabeggiatoa sp. HSG14]|uniref:type II toxin-antitoxin system VapC family toxin n=1 Tax=Candidatus Parabeggiatoa sp. HSG14 TaxID=3055593 RepID=UPI0025A79576|nr:PIN domain-containing protein [Thiotrichales bacterium HSG14]